MQLISDIINELIDPAKSLSGPFLKTKLFASKIKNQPLLTWVNLELNGYKDEQHIPSYRIYGSRLVGDFINGTGLGYWKGRDMNLPISGYDEQWQEIFSNFYFRQSIATLEKFLTDKNNSGQLEEPFPADIAEIISDRIRKNGNPYFTLTKASKRISLSVVSEMLSILRSRLLDFILKVDDEYGNVTDINKLAKDKNISSQITTIMSQTIIHNEGDGNVVNTGNENITTIQFKINNLKELENVLKENGVNADDVNALKKVIDVEKPEKDKSTFGPKVNSWIKKMLGKSLDGSWKVSIGVAAKLLADVIENYYKH